MSHFGQPQAKSEAVSMLALLSSGETIVHLRLEIGECNDFRKDVLRHFNKLIAEGEVEQAVNAAKARSANLAAINTARAKRRIRTVSKRHFFRKLSPEKCQQIRAMSEGGDYTVAQLARRFLVSAPTIARVLRERGND